MMKAFTPWAEYIFMMCHSIGWPPILTMGFGLDWVSSARRVPYPPLPGSRLSLSLTLHRIGYRTGRRESDSGVTKGRSMVVPTIGWSVESLHFVSVDSLVVHGPLDRRNNRMSGLTVILQAARGRSVGFPIGVIP